MEATLEAGLWDTRRRLDSLVKARLTQPFSESDRDEYNALSQHEAKLLCRTHQPARPLWLNAPISDGSSERTVTSPAVRGPGH